MIVPSDQTLTVAAGLAYLNFILDFSLSLGMTSVTKIIVLRGLTTSFAGTLMADESYPGQTWSATERTTIAPTLGNNIFSRFSGSKSVTSALPYRFIDQIKLLYEMNPKFCLLCFNDIFLPFLYRSWTLGT